MPLELDSNSLRLNPKSLLDVTKAMKTMFANKSADMYDDYASALCLLSDAEAIQGAAAHLDNTLAKVLNDHLKKNHKAAPPDADRFTLTDHVVTNTIVCDAKKAAELKMLSASVNRLLRACFSDYKVKGLLLDMPSAIFSDAASQSFVPLVKKGCLFEDGVTAGHGEYTHTIQWLLIAAANNAGDIKLVNDVGEMYSKAVGIETATNMLYEKPGVDTPFDKKTMWDLVVDCFLTTSTQETDRETNLAPPPRPRKMIDNYEFSASLFARNFRSPRMLQYALFGGLPKSEDRFDHAAKFLYNVALPNHAPLLCSLLQNRHRHKSLAIDMDEGKFQDFYSKRAQDKAAELVSEVNQQKSKAKPKTVKEFLEWTGRNKDHATFVPLDLKKTK